MRVEDFPCTSAEYAPEQLGFEPSPLSHCLDTQPMLESTNSFGFYPAFSFVLSLGEE